MQFYHQLNSRARTDFHFSASHGSPAAHLLFPAAPASAFGAAHTTKFFSSPWNPCTARPICSPLLPAARLHGWQGFQCCWPTAPRCLRVCASAHLLLLQRCDCKHIFVEQLPFQLLNLHEENVSGSPHTSSCHQFLSALSAFRSFSLFVYLIQCNLYNSSTLEWPVLTNTILKKCI